MAIDNYQPAPERTITVGTSGTGAVRGAWATSKDPEDSDDYWFDFSAVTLSYTPPDVITSVATPIIVSRLGLAAPTCTEFGTDGTNVMLVLAGGNDGDTATIKIQVTFQSGRTQTFVGYLAIRNLLYGSDPALLSPTDAQIAFLQGQQLTGAWTIDTAGNLQLATVAGNNLTLAGFLPGLIAAIGPWLAANANNPTEPTTNQLIVSGGIVEVAGT